MNPSAAPAFEGLWNHNIAYLGDLLGVMPPRCGTALDIGCGDGLLCRAMSQRTRQVVGLDPDFASIKAAREHSPELANVTYIEGDFRTEQFDPGTFDFITAVASLHHMPLEEALSKARELLCPGGTLAVSGCAQSHNPLDFAYDAVGVIGNRLIQRKRGWWNHAAPIAAPDRSYADVRRVANELLPGHHFVRRIYFRYTITWTRPA
ncbi:MAG: class I SAM-dependent methyltransferase [Aquihabitans sp.]